MYCPAGMSYTGMMAAFNNEISSVGNGLIGDNLSGPPILPPNNNLTLFTLCPVAALMMSALLAVTDGFTFVKAIWKLVGLGPKTKNLSKLGDNNGVQFVLTLQAEYPKVVLMKLTICG